MNNIVNILFENQTIKTVFEDSEKLYLYNQIDEKVQIPSDLNSQIRLAYLLVCNIFTIDENKLEYNKELLEKSYILFKSFDIQNVEVKNICEKTFGIENVDISTLYYFYLSSIALKSDKIINVRIDLQNFSSTDWDLYKGNWKSKLINKALEAFILLTRKNNGFSDIREALLTINRLRDEQANFEATYLQSDLVNSEIKEAYVLLGLYHISKTVVETAQYLIEGYHYKESLLSIIRQHCDAGRKLFAGEERLQSLTDILEENLKFLFTNSIWAKTKFNDNVQKLCKIKSELGIIDLMPSQRDAISKNLLDIASNVTVVQMPTSAGKTLLAEFNILVTKALKRDSKIVYVVPSRALVNQVYYDLRSDLEPIGLVIEKTSSAIEIDPTENLFLEEEKIDVLVSTPEKLDLLIRRSHPSVKDVSLFIIDEAHSIQNGHRGAKLELLLVILKRERSNSKFMLLSPFIKNSGEVITNWLGGGNSIAIDWKPSEKLLIGLDLNKTTRKDTVKYTVIPSAYNNYYVTSTNSLFETIEVNNRYELKTDPSRKKDRIFEYAARHFGQDKKTVLFLCRGKKSADHRANFIYNNIDSEGISDEINLVKKFIDFEVGTKTLISKVLEKKIAVHHAGMSDETKLLIEHLIRQKEIKYVCSTTTVAEGVNFPVSTVFFDSFSKGKEPINTNDFWNIVGRAGRTLVDNFGKVILPFNSPVNKKHAYNLVQSSANELVSVLSELFINGDKIIEHIREKKELNSLMYQYYDSLAPLVQYFVHLISVGKNEHYSIEIEDLFKDSLEYHLLDTPDKKNKFINICKSIYSLLQERYSERKNILSFADKTGFSVPSVLAVMNESSKSPNISNLKNWQPDALFDYTRPDILGDKIRVVAALRETEMGTDSDKAPFNPKLIAQVLIKWVKGEKLSVMSALHPFYDTMDDEDEKLNEFIKKVNDLRFKASWGLSALEGIVRGNSDDIKDSYVPSYIYYGVDNEKSLMLRMIGVPRSLSFSLSNMVGDDLTKTSFSKLRNQIKGLSLSDWDTFKPVGSTLDGEEWRRVSSILMNR